MFNSIDKNWLNCFEQKKSLAIIGNSPALLKMKNGKFIDSFDLVCRFNNYKINTYENYIGHKTDIYITCLIDNPDVSSEKLRNEGIKATFVTRPISSKYAYNSALGEMLKNYNLIHEFNPVFISESDFDELCLLLEIKPNSEGINPTSGITFIYALFKYFTFDKVFVSGFDFFDPRNKSNMHYFIGDVYDQENNYGLIQKYHPRINEIKVFKLLLNKIENVELDPYMRGELKWQL